MQGYKVALYAEYIPMILKSIVIMFLIFIYSSSDTNGLKAALLITILCNVAWLMEIIPLSYLNFSAQSTLPITIVSKLLQLWAMIKVKSAGSVSALTWGLNAFACFCRAVTLFISVTDKILLVSITVSTLLNLSISLTAVYYRNKEKVEEKRKSK